MIKKFMVSVCILLSAQAFSATNTWHTSEVQRVYPDSVGKVVIVFKNPSSQCSNSANYHSISLDNNGVTQDGLDKMFKTALAAGMSGIPLSIYFDSSSTSCYINRMFMTF